MIIASCGQYGNGKSFLGAEIKKLCGDTVELISIATPLKQMVKVCYPNLEFTQKTKNEMLIKVGKKDMIVRDLLRSVGKKLREIDLNFWICLTLQKMEAILKSHRSVYIDDLRYTNEAEILRQFASELNVDIKILRIERSDGFIRETTEESEISFLEIPNVITLKNDFTNRFKRYALVYAREIKREYRKSLPDLDD